MQRLLPCPVARWARLTPSATALVADGVHWSYRELDRETAGWAARLGAHGVGAGDRVAVLCGNRPELIPLVHAVARLGAAVALHNVRLSSRELAPQLEQVAPLLAIAEEALAERIPSALVLESIAREPADLARADPTPTLRADAPHSLLFTSGTTGQAKAAVLSVGNHQASALASALNLGGDRSQHWLATLPLFHVGGLAMVLRCAWYGAALSLHRGFDAERVNATLDSDSNDRITHLSLVPTTLARLLEARHGRPLPTTLRAALIGGGPASAALLARAGTAPVLHTYGLTEAASQVTTELLGGSAERRSAGVPLVGSEVRVVDGEGVALPAGEVGEIEVRGPTVMQGFWRDAEATARALRADGWLRTGDLGELDERGHLRVHARRTDLIVSGGENVYPAEVEAVLLAHPAVRDAAVLGLSDAEWGQRVAAVLVVRGPAMPSTTELEAWCRARLAGYKLPRRWLWTNGLPRNAGGKVDRAALARLWSERAA